MRVYVQTLNRNYERAPQFTAVLLYCDCLLTADSNWNKQAILKQQCNAGYYEWIQKAVRLYWMIACDELHVVYV